MITFCEKFKQGIKSSQIQSQKVEWYQGLREGDGELLFNEYKVTVIKD